MGAPLFFLGEVEMVFDLAVLSCPVLFFLGKNIFNVWRLYLLGHGEHGTAVLDEIVKGRKNCQVVE